MVHDEAGPSIDLGPPAPADRFPLAALLVMALMGFLLIATETMPAGLLPQIAAGLDVGEGTVGQFVSAFALGTIVAAIPLVALTRGLRRKPVFVAGIVVVLAANTVTAVSDHVVLSLAARFVGGASAGLVWGVTAGYARRITAPAHAGRGLAIASLGVPLGLALGTPFGSWLGTSMDWRWSFAALAALTLVAAVLAVTVIPDAPGQAPETRDSVAHVLRIPGVAVILAVIVAWMLAHNLVYTYISSYLAAADLRLSVDVALVAFGFAALAGIGITGAVIDHTLRPLVLTSIVMFLAAGTILVLAQQSVLTVLIGIVVWGLSFGGAAPQLLTAISIASGENADVANSMLGVAFNVAIFAAGVLGAVVIGHLDGRALPYFMVGLALAALALAVAGRRTAFPMRP